MKISKKDRIAIVITVFTFLPALVEPALVEPVFFIFPILAGIYWTYRFIQNDLPFIDFAK